MQSLNTLVQQGKVLYLGISDAPAWVVSKANEYARNHGLRSFSVYQGRWSAATRDFERDIIPMCRDEGMGLCPWGALGGGKFKTAEQQKAQEARTGELTEADVAVSAVLERIAHREDAVLSSIALAYVLHKAPYVFPIVGVRDMVHIQGCIDALSIELTEEDIQEIEAAIPFDLGFPHSMLWGQSVPKAPQQMWFTSLSGEFDNVEPPKVCCLRSLYQICADNLMAGHQTSIQEGLEFPGYAIWLEMGHTLIIKYCTDFTMELFGRSLQCPIEVACCLTPGSWQQKPATPCSFRRNRSYQFYSIKSHLLFSCS